MLGDFIALYLDQSKFQRIIELNKKFESHYDPYLVIRIVNHYNETTFEGLLCQGAKSFDKSKCLTKYNSRNSNIMSDYDEKKNGLFTFDGIRFFKIVNTQYKSDAEGLILFTFSYINTPTFSEGNTAFMIMPFKYEKLNIFYQNNIKAYLRNCDLIIQVKRSVDFTGADVVADTIIEQIKKAEFIICDITNCNKNVFFEIGYAKAINKDIFFY
jgi:hypothetical protein